jgi:5'-nucleotidase
MSSEVQPAPAAASSATPSPTRRPFPASDRFLPKPERVFVNRNLRFSQVGAIGFDLDHTLAGYNALPIEKLAYDLTKQKLVEKKGYPREILRFRYDPAFVVRGLVVDRARGNLIKMDYFRRVARATHGTRRIDSDERNRIYNERPQRFSSEQYVSVDTLFHLPEVHLYLQLVDWLEAGGASPDFDALYLDVRAMIDEAHRDGTLKAVITRNVGNFVERRQELPVLLDEFRRAGKKLFLLTNSEWSYSRALLKHLFEFKKSDRSWETYFDLIVVDSRKPAYFMPGDTLGLPTAVKTETGVPAWSGGHARFLEQELGVDGDAILYFGDHTYGDILRSKKSLGWRTAMIVPEVMREVEVTHRVARQYKNLERLAHEHDQLEIEKAALGREWGRLADNLRGEGDEEPYATQILGLYDPRATGGAVGVAGGFSGEELPARLRALVGGAGSGPGGKRTRGDRRRAARMRELTELAQNIAAIDHRASSLSGRIRALRRQVESEYNPTWGSIFREGNEASRFGSQLKDFACVYTGNVTNFLHYPWNYYFQSPMNLMPHDL